MIVEWTAVAEDDYLALLEDTYKFSADSGVELYERMESLLHNLTKFKHFCPLLRNFPNFVAV